MRITQAVIQFRDKLCTLDTVLDEANKWLMKINNPKYFNWDDEPKKFFCVQ